MIYERSAYHGKHFNRNGGCTTIILVYVREARNIMERKENIFRIKKSHDNLWGLIKMNILHGGKKGRNALLVFALYN